MGDKQGNQWHGGARARILQVGFLLIFVLAFGLVTQRIFEALDIGLAWGAMYIPAMAALLLGPRLATMISRRRSQRSGAKEGMFFPQTLQVGHTWKTLSAEAGEREWENVHKLPAGGTLISADSCCECGTVLLKCSDSSDLAYVIQSHLPLGQWLEWMAGIVLRSTEESPGAGRKHLAVHVFERVERAWTPMSNDELIEHLSRIAGANGYHGPAFGWTTTGRSAKRLALLGKNNEDFVMLLDVRDEELYPLWHAGIFLAFGRTPTLASDTMNPPWPEQPPANSSPPPKTQPSSS